MFSIFEDEIVTYLLLSYLMPSRVNLFSVFSHRISIYTMDSDVKWQIHLNRKVGIPLPYKGDIELDALLLQLMSMIGNASWSVKCDFQD